MRQLLLLFLTLVFFITANAQNKGIVYGTVMNESHQPVNLATATVFISSDTSLVTYRMTDNDGHFTISNLPQNILLRILITRPGFDAIRKEFTLQDQPVTLDSFVLLSTAKALDEIVLTSERPPVSVKNDTIEFNANAFRTLPNALLEDLLRKLPGVRVDKNGNITVNGKAVNKITVDGKAFFGDDPKMATRNLPADAIAKVQVVDDKDQAILNGDGIQSKVGKVVNIVLKKAYKKGAFGKVYAGAGTQSRNELGGIVNAFKDTLQVSVLAYTNNLNKPAFSYSELMNAGGLSRSSGTSGSSSMSMSTGGNGQNIQINGVNFGGNTGYGISKSDGVGINLNHTPDKKKSFYFQYYFGKVHQRNRGSQFNEYYNGDTTISQQANTNSSTYNYGHSIATGFDLRPDTLNHLRFNANYSIGLQRSSASEVNQSANSQLGNLSDGNVGTYNKVDNYNYKHNFYWTKVSASNKKRSLVVAHTLNVGTNNSNNQTKSELQYYYPMKYDSLQALIRTAHLPMVNANTSASFRIPLSFGTINLTARHLYDYVSNKIQNNNYSSFSFNPADLLVAQAGKFQRSSNTFTLTQAMIFKFGKWQITPSLGEMYLSLKPKFDNDPENLNKTYRKLLPNLSINYGDLNLEFNRNYTLPNYSYFIPVTNTSNPYYIVENNKHLNLQKQDNISANLYHNYTKQNMSIYFYGQYSNTDNDIIYQTSIDEKGVQTVRPINANGTKNIYGNGNINKDFKFGKNNSLTFSGGFYYDNAHSRMLYNGVNSWQNTSSLSLWPEIDLNLNDVFSWENSYSPYWTRTSYSSTQFSPIKVFTQEWTSRITVRAPKHFIWENNFEYTYNNSLPSGRKNLLRWTAALNYTFLKDERGVLKLMAYDILNQNKNSSNVSATKNQLQVTRGLMMPRYMMLTFTYNIRKIGAKKQKIGGGGGLFNF